MAALEAKIEKRFSLASTLQEEALFSFTVAVVIFQQHTHTHTASSSSSLSSSVSALNVFATEHTTRRRR